MFPTNDPNDITLYTEDSPETGFSARANQTSAIDVNFYFKMYLVAKYDDGSLYPVAYATWQVKFFADQWQQNQGVTKVEIPNGVTADPSQLSNEEPRKLIRPVAAEGISWQ